MRTLAVPLSAAIAGSGRDAVIFTSSKARTEQSARLIRDALSTVDCDTPVIPMIGLGPDDDPTPVVEACCSAVADKKGVAVVVVGHDKNLASLATALTGTAMGRKRFKAASGVTLVLSDPDAAPEPGGWRIESTL